MANGSRAPDMHGTGRPSRPFERTLGAFEGLSSELTADLTLAAADLALLLDGEGKVIEVAFDDPSFSKESIPEWVGKPWLETVTIESRAKVEELLNEARSGRLTRSREVNHHRASPPDLPIRYRAARLNKDGLIIALGTDLRPLSRQQQQIVDAQIRMEQEYAKLRKSEARFRLLFRLASEAMFVVDAAREVILDANPAGEELADKPLNRLTGQKLSSLFDNDQWPVVSDLLAAARSGAGPINSTIEMSSGEMVSFTISLFQFNDVAQFMIKMKAQQPSAVMAYSGQLDRVVDALPDGFFITDELGKIILANPAFAEMTGATSSTEVISEGFERWIGKSQVDINIILSTLGDSRTLRNFETVIRDEYGTQEEVELTAVAIPNGDVAYFGFVLRRLCGTIRATNDNIIPTMRTANQLTSLIGRVPMKELVRQSTDMIEKLCIESALEITKNNRASAAEILGLSRQSFYQKLNRYGLA